MSEIEAITYCVIAIAIAWGLRGMKLVDVNYQGEKALFKSDIIKDWGKKGPILLDNERKL